MRDPRKHIDLLENRYKGGRILVCGLGPSFIDNAEAIKESGILTIGVNDIGRWLDPDYLLIVDMPGSFSPRTHRRERSLEFIINTRPERATVVNVQHLERWDFLLKGKHRKVLGQQGTAFPSMANAAMPPWVDQVPQLHMGGGGSPVTAVSLAGFMGATDIGVIGVDLLDHPILEKQRLQQWNYVWDRMRLFLEEKGVSLWNLSPESDLTKYVPRTDLHEWLAERPQGQAQGEVGDRARQRAEQIAPARARQRR